MVERLLASNTYGNLGRYERRRPGLYRSPSGLIHLLGEGPLNGKGEGIAFLDRARAQVAGYDVPRSLIVCSDFTARTEEIIRVLHELEYSRAIAIRSSAEVEDQIGRTAAGVFRTEFHAEDLSTDGSRSRFAAKLSRVPASAYTRRAKRYWHEAGYSDASIPPLSVIIQEVAGTDWQYAPRYFLPAVSGIVNTSSLKAVRVAMALGLGLAAVGRKGLGRLYKLPAINERTTTDFELEVHRGALNVSDVFCLDSASGNVAHLRAKEAEALFPTRFLGELDISPSSLLCRTANIALALEKIAGHPLDLEYASTDGRNLTLVQARPVNRRTPVEKPAVDGANLLLESSDVLGYGDKEFAHLIWIDSSYGCPTAEKIASLARRFPGSLICFRHKVGSYSNSTVETRLLPHVNAVVVIDVDSKGHKTGTGMQHFALDLADRGKIFIYSERGPSETILDNAEIVHEEHDDFIQTLIKVFRPSRPLRVAADDEHDWGMVYST